MKKSGLIIKKELFRIFGDRKMVFSLYVLPVVIVIVIYSLMGRLIGSMEKDVTEHKSVITVVNASDEYKQLAAQTGYDSIAETTYLDSKQFADRQEALEKEIHDGDSDLIVIFEDDFNAAQSDYLSGGSSIPGIKICYNDTERYSSNAYAVFSTVIIDTYKTTLLSGRYGDVSLLDAINVETENICKEEKANTEFISMMLPYMIVMMLFAGVMSVGVDAIAGEKERGTLASMLISPVKRREIAVGKLVSMGILSGISAIVYCISMIIASHMMGTDTLEGFGGISFNALQIVELLLVMLALVFLYVGIVALISVISTNTKTASSAISPIYIVIVLAGMCTMFRSGSKTSTLQYMIPVYGNALAISDICSNELSLINFVASFGITFLIGVALTLTVARAFESEKLMFNA
ncbi:MAG: ABC transporter permease [Lachnospiraceae bacterium]|nr:ABC transporter permease [Lachnospiraceae bacterium]